MIMLKELTTDTDTETAYTYEKSRWQCMLQVTRSVKLLREMPQRVEHAKGIALSGLSNECRELAVRCDCDKLPYIFALPECFIEAKRAIVVLETWLQNDKKYTSFILKSMKLLEEKYSEAKKQYVQAKSQLRSCEHK
ncbi:unnamed protein product, partial [Didymodactylos carnosus]